MPPDYVAFDPQRILKVLARHQVQCVVIGGYAAVLAGVDIVTRDIDITPATDGLMGTTVRRPPLGPGPSSVRGLEWLARVGPAPADAWAAAMGWSERTRSRTLSDCRRRAGWTVTG